MKKDKKFEIIVLTLLLLSLLILFLILNWFSPLLSWDENVYLGNARSHIAQSNFTEDFRFPLLEWLISLCWLLGESLLVAKILVILITLGTVFFAYLISKEYFSIRKAFFVTLGFGFSPLILLWGFKIYADIPALFFTVVSFYCIFKSEKAENKKKEDIFIALAGIMSALAFLARFSLALFALSVGIYFIFKKRYKRFFTFLAFFVLALVPWLVYNQIYYQDIIWDLKEQYSVIEKWTQWEPIIKQIENLFTSMGLFAILLPLGIYSLLKKRSENKTQHRTLTLLILIYTALSFIYYFCFVKLKDMRYYLAFLPFLYIIAFDGLFWFNSKINKKGIEKIIYLLVTFNIILLFGVNLYSLAKISDYERNGALYQAVSYLKEEGAYNSSILSNVWPWFGYHLNAKVASLWSENLTELIQIYAPYYFIYDNRVGTYFNKTILDGDTRLKLEKEIKDSFNHEVFIYRTESI